MVGIINIIGLIGSDENEKGVELINVIQQVKSQPEATSFEININSQGGKTDAGFEIYEYIKSINLPTKTIAKNMCASSATLIFLAGKEREIELGCQFMIHMPFYSPFEYFTAQEMEFYLEQLQICEKKVVNFYKENTRLTAEEIIPLLKKESWLNESQAYDFGFTTYKRESLKAVAYFINPSTNKNNNKMPEQNLSTESKNWLETKLNAFAKSFKIPKIVNLTLQDSNGVDIVFPDLADDATPVENDFATVDGQPAEGDYIMPQLENAVVTFAAGTVTAITVQSVDNTAQIATLQAQIDALTSDKTALTNQLQSVNVAFNTLRKDVKSKFEFVDTKERVQENNNESKARKLFKD